MRVPFFGEIIRKHNVQQDAHKLYICTDMLPPHNKKNSSFLGILNYLGKFSLPTTVVCKPLRTVTSNKYESTWNST